MNEMQIFNSPEFGSIRAIEDEGEPWFVGKDVADALGYANSRMALKTHVEEEDKGCKKVDTPGGAQTMTVVNESGLYSLVFGSELKNARKFKRWVTSEIIPSIRKHGMYATEATVENFLNDPDSMIQALVALKDERKARHEAELKAEQMKPKALFADAVAASSDTILIGQLAKLLKQNGVDMGQNRLFAWMRENGFLCKSGTDYNMPTQYAMERGLFELKERTVANPDGSVRLTRTTKVTGKGQQYFVNKFLSN